MQCNGCSTLSDLFKHLTPNSRCASVRVPPIAASLGIPTLQQDEAVDQTPVYPREVIKRALFHEASAIILVHNHPSGNATPSPEDIALTKEIVKACSTIFVKVHDHIIICKNDFYSFKSNMLI